MPTVNLEPRQPRAGALYWAPPGAPLGHIGLLHGVTSASTTWWGLGPMLAARGWDVTAVDLPGHGQGPKARAHLESLAQLAEDTVPLLPERLTVIVGHSLGAVVALAVAIEDEDLAAGVVLIEPPALGSFDTSLFAAGIEAEGELVRNEPDSVRQRVRRDHPSWDDAEVERVIAARSAADTRAIAEAMRADLRWDLPTLVDATTVPVLVIAAPDSSVPFYLGGTSALLGDERARLADMLPEERFVVVEGGHSLHRDQPEKVSELILEFADELRPRDNLPDPETE